jgi:ribosome-associated translation inhibitor RaiA
MKRLAFVSRRSLRQRERYVGALRNAGRWESYPYNRDHLLQSLVWLERIAPDAPEAVRIATVTHDMEYGRIGFFVGGSGEVRIKDFMYKDILNHTWAPEVTGKNFKENEAQTRFRSPFATSALEEEIRSRASRLESFYPRIVGCRVVLEVPNRHRRHGRPVHVRIELSLPGEDVIVNHEPTPDTAARSESRKRDELEGHHKDAHVAIREAFDVARRRLEDVARQQRGDVKTHAVTTPM